jgi:hypothetical protein
MLQCTSRTRSPSSLPDGRSPARRQLIPTPARQHPAITRSGPQQPDARLLSGTYIRTALKRTRPTKGGSMGKRLVCWVGRPRSSRSRSGWSVRPGVHPVARTSRRHSPWRRSPPSRNSREPTLVTRSCSPPSCSRATPSRAPGWGLHVARSGGAARADRQLMVRVPTGARPGYLTQDLLEIARLTRNRDQAEATLGRTWCDRALALPPAAGDGPGRLVPVFYTLAKPAPGDSSSVQHDSNLI